MPKAVDKHPQARGLGNALWNPLRSGVTGWSDPYSAIDDAAAAAGGGIRARIESVLDDIVEAVEELTGIDISTPVALLEQLLAQPLGFLGSTTLGGAVDVLGQFLPWLPGADPDDFDPADAATELVTSRLLPTGLLAGLVGGFLDEAKLPGLGALRDAIGQAIDGGTGTGYTLALVKSRMENIPSANIVSLAAAKVIGALAPGNIPGLDASKIISGTFPTSMTGLQTLIDGVVGGSSNPLSSLISSLSGTQSTASTASSTASSVNTGLGNLLNGLFDAFNRSTGSTGITTSQAAAVAASVTSDVVTTQASTDTLTAAAVTPGNTPYWLSKGSGDDVNYPIVDVTAAGSTGGLGLVRMSPPIVASQDRTYDVLRFGIAGTTMTSCLVGVYKIDRATGAHTKVADLGNVKGSLSTSYKVQSLSLPSPLTVSRGDVFAIAVLQIGGTGAGFYESSDPTVDMTDNLNTFPRWPRYQVTASAQTSLAASYTDAQMSSGGTSKRFWAALGSTPAGSLKSYADSFNRSDSGTLGASWLHKFRSGGSGELCVRRLAAGNPASNSNHHISAYVQKLTSADQEVEMTVVTLGTITAAYLSLRGDDGNVCFAKWDGSTCVIYTNTAYSNTGTSRDSGAAPSFASTQGKFRFRAVGNVYTAYVDDVSMATWTDSGGVHPTDASQVEVAIGAAQTGGFTLDGAIEKWSARDL